MDVKSKLMADILMAICPWETPESVYCLDELSPRTRQAWPTVVEDLLLLGKAGMLLLTDDREAFVQLFIRLGSNWHGMFAIIAEQARKRMDPPTMERLIEAIHERAVATEPAEVGG